MPTSQIASTPFDEQLKNYRLPRYLDFPDIELYMDQVLSYLNKYFTIFNLASDNENFITSSMINNYVKHEIIPAPIGKKYARKHLAYIVTVSFLKQALSMNEIKIFIKQQLQHNDELTTYHFFCETLENAFHSLANHLSNIEIAGTEWLNISLGYVALAISTKLYAQTIINLNEITSINKKEKEKEKEKNKGSEKNKEEK